MIFSRRPVPRHWLLTLAVGSAACSGQLPTAPTERPIAQLVPPLQSLVNRTLNWEGTNSDGLGVGFQISGERVTGIYIELPEVQGDSCVFGAGGFSIDGFDNFDLVWGLAYPPITNGSFTVTSVAPIGASFGASPASAAVDFNLSGRINGSSGEGTGEFRFGTRSGSPICAAKRQVTWSISKKLE
jgi:hypothetical protein